MLAATLALALTLSSPGPVVVVGPQQVQGVRSPSAAVDDLGNIYVVFGSGENIYCAMSDNKGKSFEPPLKVATAPHLAIGMRRGPRVAISNSRIVVSAISDGNLMV